MLYLYKVETFDELEDCETMAYGLVSSKNYVGAVKEIVEIYGEDNLNSIEHLEPITKINFLELDEEVYKQIIDSLW